MNESDSTHFKTGQRVFNRSGQEAEYLCKTPEGHAVKPVYIERLCGDEVSEEFTGITLWHEIFLKPPTEKLHKEVEELDKKIQLKRNELFNLQTVVASEEKVQKARLEKLKKLEGLEKLEEFIDGKITHFVSNEGWRGIHVQTKDEALKSDNSWGKEQKLLCLFGDTNGRLTWRTNHYKDGSGSWVEVYPVTSEAEALVIARRLWDAEVKEWQEKKSRGRRGTIVGLGNKYGWPIPEGLLAELAKEELEAASKAQQEIYNKAVDAGGRVEKARIEFDKYVKKA